jgi:bifunctional enzyme CysN/CysC
MGLLRFATAGSVDDGKSTLIGRLLLDSKQIFEDQLDAVERSSRDRGYDYTNLALLTDGLRAEREQGITIDVAYRYFATPRRKFIIADTPGHVHYTRNMVTGASTADLALILIDARNGLREQSRRHAVIASLLRVKHLVVCVNKMDLVDYEESVFNEVRDEFSQFAERLEFTDLTFIPISALDGDNVVSHSANMPWYGGATLLWHLENAYVASDRNLIDPRFPVQYVIRPMSRSHPDYRGYAGRVEAGVFRPGDEVLCLPSGFTTTIESIEVLGEPVAAGEPNLSLTMILRDPLDVSRGDLICRPGNRPHSGQDIDAMVCWFSDQPMSLTSTYSIKHTTRTVRGRINLLRYRLDTETLHREEGVEQLGMNEIGRVTMRTTQPLFFDPYHRCRSTGSFIFVDEATNETVGCGMILGPAA